MVRKGGLEPIGFAGHVWDDQLSPSDGSSLSFPNSATASLCCHRLPLHCPSLPAPHMPADPEMAGSSMAEMFSFNGVAAMLSKRSVVLPAW